MDWQFPVSSPRLRAPDDGIVASYRPRGWLAKRWLELLERIGKTNRLARGRTLARGGRVRDLWFAPGLANAEVYDSDVHRVSVRVRVFEDHEWAAVNAALLRNLVSIADMIEGDLPERLVSELEASGLTLVPPPDELDGDCDCQDYALPCSHVAAVHGVLTDALDGDPFLLLTLRGRPREQLFTALRKVWGDDQPLQPIVVQDDEAPPEGDWTIAPVPLPEMRFHIPTRPATGCVALRALGPAPDGADLFHALGPLYAAGAEAAWAMAMDDRELTPSHTTPPTDDTSAAEPEEASMAKARSTKSRSKKKRTKAPVTPQIEPNYTLTERLVDALAEVESAKSKDLADELGVPMLDVRQELLELEKLGIVYRTGQTRGTRWWLG